MLQNTRFLLGARAHFFHDADPEALRMRAWCKFHFFQKVFSIFYIFFMLAFWVVQCSRFASNNSIWEPPGRIYRPPWGGLREVFLLANPLFYLRNLMFFLKTINFPMRIWYFWSLVGLLDAVWVLGLLLESSCGFLCSHLWSWMISGVLFGCVWALFGLLFRFLDNPWHHIY